MAKDARTLRDDATAASAAGKFKKALECYLELEQVEPRDAQWPKRAAETYRRLLKPAEAISAYQRAADRYAQSGFLVQAIAVCKMILQIQPDHGEALRRLATINEQVGAGPTRVGTLAESNTSLHEHPSVAMLRTGGQPVIAPPMGGPLAATMSQLVPVDRGTGSMPTLGPAGPSAGAPDRGPTSTSQAGLGPAGAPAPRRRGDSAAPPRARGDSSPAVAVPRTRSKPITIQPGAALDTVDLHSLVAGSHHRDVSGPGIAVIPLDDDEMVLEVDAGGDDDGGLEIETLAVETDDDEVLELEPAEVDDVSELELGDLEEIPLPVPRAVGAAARRALAATPLFAGLPSEALEDLVGRLTIVPLGPGEILFNEGDPGDALYVIVEGEVSVSGQGPTHGELSRLGPGAFIGEVALMTEQPRAATVAAVEHAELLRIDRVTLSEVLANHGDLLRAVLRFVRERLVDRWMRTSPLFRPFDDSERSALVARFRFLEIEAGTVVLTPGTRPDGLYIVLAGQLSVKRDVATAALLGPGDLIGENALLSGGKIQSEVAARTKVLALCLPAADFREMIMTHPHVLEYIGEQAEQRRRLHIL